MALNPERAIFYLKSHDSHSGCARAVAVALCPNLVHSRVRLLQAWSLAMLPAKTLLVKTFAVGFFRVC
jgi:hypothetical protein